MPGALNVKLLKSDLLVKLKGMSSYSGSTVPAGSRSTEEIHKEYQL
jgi:hypothetical protein